MDILDFFAERDGDVDARMALRVRELSSSSDYLQLAEFCLSHGRADQALRWAEEALWKYEDGRPDVRLAMLAVDLLSRAGRTADAEAQLWRLFEKAPTFDLYTRLCGLGGKAAGERALSLLEARQTSGARSGWNSPTDLLIRIWIDEKKFDAAWETVRKHGASPRLAEELAGKSEATHPREVLEVYTQRVDQLVKTGGKPNYEQAAKLVARMTKLHARGEHVAYVLGLKQRFARRRQFTELLE
jgi:tetratricopeptide (TPR) repeat protein